MPFSHTRHAPLRLKCVSCHAGAESSERASFPDAGKCQVCHTTLELPKDAKMVPEKPAYVLPDFVFFSHAKHAAAKVSCETCHGDVWRQDPVMPFLAMKMKACIDCHKANKVAVACNLCHDLSP